MLCIFMKEWITVTTCIILSIHIELSEATNSNNDKIGHKENLCFLSGSNIPLYCLPSAGEASLEKQCSESEMKSAAHSGSKVVIRALVAHDPPFVILCHDVAGRVTYASGFILDIWKTLEEKLNFTTLFVIDSTNSTSTQFEFQNTQLQELTASKADAIIGAIIPTSNLSESDPFPMPVINLRFEAYLRDPNLETFMSTQRYVKSLDPSLWGLTLATLLIISVMLTFSSRVGQSYEEDPGEAFIVVLGALLQQGSDKNPPLTSGRVLLWTSFAFGLIMFTSYSAQLISSLAVHRTHIPYSTLREWFRNKEHRVRLEEGSYAFHYLQRWVSRERLETSASLLTALELLSADGEFVVIAESQRVLYLLSRENSGSLACRLVPVQGQVFSVEAGIVFNNEHFLKPRIEIQVSLMTEPVVTRCPLPIFAEMKHVDELSRTLATLLGQFPEGLSLGAAVEGADNFFDAVAQGLNELLDADAAVSVTSLRRGCRDFAAAVGGDGGVGSWLEAALEARGQKLRKYARRVVRNEFGGSLDVEGRMIGEQHGVQVEVLEVSGGSAVVGEGRAGVVRVVHYRDHYVPLLAGIQKDVRKSRKVSRDEVYGRDVDDRMRRPATSLEEVVETKKGCVLVEKITTVTNDDDAAFKEAIKRWLQQTGQNLEVYRKEGRDLSEMSIGTGSEGPLDELWFNEDGGKTKYLESLEKEGVSAARMSCILSGAGSTAFHKLYGLWFDKDGNKTQCLQTLEEEGGIKLADVSSVLVGRGSEAARVFQSLYSVWFDADGKKTPLLEEFYGGGFNACHLSMLLNLLGDYLAGKLESA